MTRYSVQPNDQIFVKVYGFLSLPKNIGKNIDKNISNSISSKYTQKLLDHAKQPAKYSPKTTSKKANQKTAKATGDLIGKFTTQKIQKQLKVKQKYQKKDIYLQEKGRRLLMISD